MGDCPKYGALMRSVPQTWSVEERHIMAIRCSTCGEGPTPVRETRGNRRARRCRACGEVFYTREVPEGDLEALREWRARYRELVDAVTVLTAAPVPEELRAEAP